MKRWTTAIRQSFGIWLLAAAVLSHVPFGGPLCLGEKSREQSEEEKNGPGEEERAKEAVVHAVRRHGRGHHERQPLETSSLPKALHPCAAAWQRQLCLADAMRGERGFYNGCGATLRC